MAPKAEVLQLYLAAFPSFIWKWKVSPCATNIANQTLQNVASSHQALWAEPCRVLLWCRALKRSAGLVTKKEKGEEKACVLFCCLKCISSPSLAGQTVWIRVRNVQKGGVLQTCLWFKWHWQRATCKLQQLRLLWVIWPNSNANNLLVCRTAPELRYYLHFVYSLQCEVCSSWTEVAR